VKQRAIYVYLPSLDMVNRWKGFAGKQGVSISKFVIEHVENSLRQEEEPEYKSRGELLMELQKFREELAEEKKRNRRLDLVVDRLEKELRRYRAQPFLEEEFDGVRSFSRELVQVLRDGRLLSGDELLSRLGIEPTEHDVVKSVSKQLEILESYGLVRSSPKGWRWMD
jgi:hypothetical protein